MKHFGLTLSSRHFVALVVAASLASGVAEARSPHPFTAPVTIMEVTVAPSAGCFLNGDITGTGTATGLGALTLTSHDCINQSGQGFTFASTQLVLTASNGNQVFATYSRSLMIPTGPTLGFISGSFQIVGGTGRFLNATGVGAVAGTEDLTTGKGQVTFGGTILY
jgi:hypothetical protein